MGKICRLSERSSCFEDTIKLIEQSFQYRRPFSFAIDFAPLVDKSNHHNCFIMLDENEKVIAHIGVREQFLTLGKKKFSFCMLGGIAVDETRRGEGNFQELLLAVLAEKRDETSLFLLWSDKEKLYHNYGFHLCGVQFEYASAKKNSPFEKTIFKNLKEDDKKSVQSLYDKSFCKINLSITRTIENWNLIEKITSAELYIRRRDGAISEYYFMNKGQDLTDIIYEYGTTGDLKSFLQEISSFGKVWMGSPFLDTEILQYQYMMSPGNLRDFTEFIQAYTDSLFVIRNINLMKQEVFFDFNEETLVLSVEEFLRGVFGPEAFEELGEIRPLFISGLDSI